MPFAKKKYSLEIDVVRSDTEWPATFENVPVEDIACNAINAAISVADIEFIDTAEICVVLSNDVEQQILNQKWRGQNKTTNVLSFPQIEPFAPLRGMLGDITIARQTVFDEAKELQKPAHEHFTHLVVHGFLHILGYDHETDIQALQMESLETKVLASMGICDPYA